MTHLKDDTVTHFLKIPSNLASIKGTAIWKKIYYYDKTLKYIGLDRDTSGQGYLVTDVPNNAVYMRLQYCKNNDNLTFYPADSNGNEIKLARNISIKSVKLSGVTTTWKNLFDKENVVNLENGKLKKYLKGLSNNGNITVSLDYDVINEKLYSDINRRVDIMFEMGLEKEARSLYENYGEDIQAFAAIFNGVLTLFFLGV